ncbi:MAG: ATP:cob(I)alamin adenosyltransferase [Verrucomicrobia bacterium]|nr:ATP:cob(I)alamin adenosyltransferase [Verrucomicrobiota bacterium]
MGNVNCDSHWGAQIQSSGKSLLEKIQKALVGLMGELAVATEDLPRYEADGYARIKDEDLALLDKEIERLEKDAPPAKGWSTPGGNSAGAALDLARAVCRRGERGVWRLEKKEGNVRTIIPRYLNRLSDLLWLLERDLESAENSKSST